MAEQGADFVIIGGGVVGLCLALEAKRRHRNCRVTVLEKEPGCGLHASGRNSGVLHAGFYYTADSLKARFTREGNQWWTATCLAAKLPIRRCGKLVVARSPADWPGMAELMRRAQANGVSLEALTAEEARRIEPRVRTCEQALFSPTTATVDPRRILAHLADQARQEGIRIQCDTRVLDRAPEGVLTNRGVVGAGYVINAAGLYADRLAQRFGFARDYAILPFKGLYLYSDEPPESLRVHLYPVPDLHHPFLGVHHTVTVEGKTKIGPTAIPAFWREHYQGLQGFRWEECLELLRRQAGLWFRDAFDFRRLAWEEFHKYRRRHLCQLAAVLATGVEANHYRRWGPPGIRAQLLRLSTQSLEMDFCFEGDHRSLHVLNAVSPGFTCAMPFARFLFDRIDGLR